MSTCSTYSECHVTLDTYISRSIREDLPSLQRTTDSQEENPREEAYTEPSLQRILPIRCALQRGPAKHQPGAAGTGLGSHDEKRSHWSPRNWSQTRRTRGQSLERGHELPTETDCRVA